MQALERELAFRHIENVFDKLGDEMLAQIILPKGLDRDDGAMDDGEYVEYLARTFEEHGIPRELWELTAGDNNDPIEIEVRSDEFVRRLIEPRRERILFYARRSAGEL